MVLLAIIIFIRNRIKKDLIDKTETYSITAEETNGLKKELKTMQDSLEKYKTELSEISKREEASNDVIRKQNSIIDEQQEIIEDFKNLLKLAEEQK